VPLGPSGAFVQRSARERLARSREERDARRDKPQRLAACGVVSISREGDGVGEAFINACASYLYCYVRNARVYLHARSADLTMHARDPARAISTSASLFLSSPADLHAQMFEDAEECSTVQCLDPKNLDSRLRIIVSVSHVYTLLEKTRLENEHNSFP